MDDYPATENEQEDRNATVTFSYPEAEKVSLTVTQSAPAPVEPELSFSIEVTGLTTYSVTVSCSPSDKEATYVLEMKSKEAYEAFQGDDSKLIASDIEDFLAGSWSDPGKIEDHLLKGDVTGFTEYFEIGTDEYYIIAYGLNADGTATSSKVTKMAVSPLVEPELVLSWDSQKMLPSEGGSFSIGYTIKNPHENGTVIPECYSSWITDLKADDSQITFTVAPDDGSELGESRAGTIFIYYKDKDGMTLCNASAVVRQSLL